MSMPYAFSRAATVLTSLMLALATAMPAAAQPAPPTPTPPSPGEQGARPPETPPVPSDMISLADAERLAKGIIAICAEQHEYPVVLVSDALGNMRLAIAADHSQPIGWTSVQGKTRAVLDFRVSTHELYDRLQKDKAFADRFAKDPRYFLHPGALPLYRDGRWVAILAVGGGHQADEGCALRALARVPWAKVSP
jgi:uncharacterized protein GlcG (DUF336 family)